VQLVRHFGAHVTAVCNGKNVELARSLGADEVVDADGEQAVAIVRTSTGGHGADVVLQCAPSARAEVLAIAMGGPAGRIVLVGAALEPFSVRAAEIFWRELAVLGSRGFVPDDIRDAIDLYLAGSVSVDHLLSATRPLDEAQAALDALGAGTVLRSVLVP
jgi:S-(hydroxymethyl)mycothiol dehydrogenase